MVDKFKSWTWPTEALPEDVLGLDRLLAHVALYWFTGTARSAAFVGYANPSCGDSAEPSPALTAFIQFAPPGLEVAADGAVTIGADDD
ncbi:hypothetical protein ACAG26_14455 [Mycobacterium sp. pUA109]|uniref:hypothetical protein n=1 Tax=Mycobacterium sp. pUA109 TaxID=3238982 RepID=UPI00351B5838